MLKYLISSGIYASLVILSNTAQSEGLSPKIYQKIDPREIGGGGIPPCYIHKCVSVGRAGDSERTSSPSRRLNSSPTNPSNSTSVDNSAIQPTVESNFESAYQAPAGVLGANVNLEAEFSDFINANREFTATFGLNSSVSTGQVSSDSFNIDKIKTTTYSQAKDAWGEIINSQNDYFDGIAALAEAGDDPQAQNAIAHATISAHLAVDFGGEIAEAVGDTKEIVFDGGELDTAKDLLNNTAGRDIALEIIENGGSVVDIPAAISDAYRNGRLWIIRNKKIVPSSTKKTTIENSVNLNLQ